MAKEPTKKPTEKKPRKPRQAKAASALELSQTVSMGDVKLIPDDMSPTYIQVGPYMFMPDGTVDTTSDYNDAANTFLEALRKIFPDFFKTDMSSEVYRKIRNSLYAGELEHIREIYVDRIRKDSRSLVGVAMASSISIFVSLLLTSTQTFPDLTVIFSGAAFLGILISMTMALGVCMNVRELYQWLQSSEKIAKAQAERGDDVRHKEEVKPD